VKLRCMCDTIHVHGKSVMLLIFIIHGMCLFVYVGLKGEHSSPLRCDAGAHEARGDAAGIRCEPRGHQ
jgi:hypothetical protein